MKILKILFASLVVVLATLFIFSCAKETESVQVSSQQTVENRASGSACSPQSLFTEYTNCTNTPRNYNISFALGYSLYSTSSKLFQLCPGLQVNVTYMYTKCIIPSIGAEVHFVHDLNYNLAAMIAACPALQTEISNQTALGNLESFLDLIDHEISMQAEFTEAFNAAQNQPNKYRCTNRNFYSVKYISNTCYKWVPYLDGPKDRPIAAFKKEDCGSSVCCARSNDYCVESFVGLEPNLIIGTPTNYQKFEGSCAPGCTHDCGAPDPDSF